MPVGTKALVLSGGGTAGGAWMLGLIKALCDEGIDLGDADLIVGTSAGARVGAQLAGGNLEGGVASYRDARIPELELPVPFEVFAAAVRRIVTETPDRQHAAKRLANLEPLGSQLVSGDDRRRMIAAHITSDEWPDKPLAITAVAADTGSRTVFTAQSGVTLLDALGASGALPGIFPLVTVNGKRYSDGGVHSPYNADLAVGNDVILIVSPLAAGAVMDALLESELAALGDARVHLIRADDASLSAIGPDPFSSKTAQAAVTAGARQAAREAERVKNLWPA